MKFEEVLPHVESRLELLADRLDPPVDQLNAGQQIVLSLGLHGRELYAGVRQACTAGSVATAMVVLRPAVEDAILVRWLESDLPMHSEMWLAEDNRNLLVGADAFEELRRRRGRPLSVRSPDETVAMRGHIKSVRKKAVMKGEPINPDKGSVLPSVEQMVDLKDNALWEAYQVAYRSLSPYTHSGGRAFVGYRYERRVDGTHLVAGHDWTTSAIRGLAATTFLLTIECISRVCELGIEDEAASMRDLVATWPSDAIA